MVEGQGEIIALANFLYSRDERIEGSVYSHVFPS